MHAAHQTEESNEEFGFSEENELLYGNISGA
jgi:hypothetical protein